MSKKLAKLKSIEDIPKDMTEEEAAKFYSTHDLGDIWDELEPFEESIELSPELQKTMVHLRLEPTYLKTVNQWPKR